MQLECIGFPSSCALLKMIGGAMNDKKRTSILTALLAVSVLVSLTGIAAANPYDLIMNQGSPNQGIPEPNDILLVPGVAHNSSLLGEKFIGGTPQTFPLTAQVFCFPGNTPPLDTDCHTSDLSVTFNHVTGITDPFPSFGPVMDNNATFLAVDSVTITLKENATDPLGTNYTVLINSGPGTTGGETASASRTLTSTPATPTPTPMPKAFCLETVNPAGKKIPPAGSTTLPGARGGQNEDGFYELQVKGFLPPVEIFVKDTGSGTIFPSSPIGFPPGTKIKYTQAPGAMPSIKKIGGPSSAVDWHITGTGDAAVYAVDVFGDKGPEVLCKVPPPPK
jgi:hypothetical protein